MAPLGGYERRQDSGHDQLPVHGGQIRGRGIPLGLGSRDDQTGNRRRLIEELGGGQHREPLQSRSHVAAELGKRRRTAVADDAEGPETGINAQPSATFRSSRAARQVHSGRKRDVIRHSGAGADRSGDEGGGGGGIELPADQPHSDMPGRGRRGARGKEEDPVERCATPPEEAADARSTIRGQGILLGPRGAGSQCSDADCSRASKEDEKIHLYDVHAGRINYTAYRGRGAAGVANATAVEVAASMVAWHTDAASGPPAEGG